MILADQVELLGQNVEQLRNQRIVLPILGGSHPTKDTYHFKSLVHPARDIAATISASDPSGSKLPSNLRGWNLSVSYGQNICKNVPLKKLLGMVIHVDYLNISDNQLDISNDLGERVIIEYDKFMSQIERLLLTPEEICLVVCCLVEEKIKNQSIRKCLIPYGHGSGDLMHLLVNISKWPKLKEMVWTAFFANHSTAVDSSSQTINDCPFLMGSQYKNSITIWQIGWRRNGIYSSPWVNVDNLIHMIRDYFKRLHSGMLD